MQYEVLYREANNIIKAKSASKINPALWIKNKRSDGYHEIETIFFENTNLCDEVCVEVKPNNSENIKVDFVQKDLNLQIPNEINHAYKAAKLFFEKIDYSGGCNITIDKKIPLQAGLGGGSSNAASVLKALNIIFDYQLHESELLILANKIGADVPFFILGGTCLASGIGEKLNVIDNKLNLDIKIVKPETISISTKWAYEEFDKSLILNNNAEKLNSLIKAMKMKNYKMFFNNIFNDFEEVIFKKYPKLQKIKQNLLSEGYGAACLCGSGSAVFGVKPR